MKRKSPARNESPVAPEILEEARRSLASDRVVGEAVSVPPKPALKCLVCNAEASGSTSEPLCWVCRRLKISAWRDAEQQVPAQE
jgi:hypothetical protein